MKRRKIHQKSVWLPERIQGLNIVVQVIQMRKSGHEEGSRVWHRVCAWTHQHCILVFLFGQIPFSVFLLAHLYREDDNTAYLIPLL